MLENAFLFFYRNSVKTVIHIVRKFMDGLIKLLITLVYLSELVFTLTNYIMQGKKPALYL